MNAADRSLLRKTLHTRCEAIAESWYQAITSTNAMPSMATAVRQRLLELSQQTIEVLLAEPFEDEPAQTIGASLAGLDSIRPQALGRTLEALSRLLGQGLSDEQVVALQPRLAPLLGGIATGFVRQACHTVLAEQEQIRQTLTGELQSAQETLRQADADVERRIQERTRELRASNELLQQEILERRQAEEALARSREMIRTVLDASTDDLVGLIDADGILLEANQAAAVRFDKRLDELVGLCIWDLLPPDLAERRKARAEKVFQSGQLVRFEDERAGAWFESVFYPVFDEQGRVTKVAVIARDITERKQAEGALRQSEETVRALLNATTDDVMVLFNADGTILEANETTARRFGKRVDEMPGLYGWGLLPPDLAHSRRAYADEVFRSGQSVRFEDERAGMWFDNVFYPILDAQGAVTHLAVAARDITERKRMEEELRRLLDETARDRRLVLALSQAAQAVQRARTWEEIYRLIGDEIGQLGYQALVFALGDEGTHLIVAHITCKAELLGAAEELTGLPAQGFRFPLSSKGPLQQILSQGQPVFVEEPADLVAESLGTSPSPLVSQLAKLLAVDGTIFAPLVVGDEAHGLLAVTGAGLSEDDTQAISAFANQTAIALDNARLHQEAQSWVAELEWRVAERTQELSAITIELEAEVVERQRAESELRRAQEETLRNHRLLLALSQAAQAVQRARTPQEVYQTIGDEVAKFGCRAVVLTVSEDRLHLIISHVTLESALLRAVEKLSGLTRRALVPLAPDGFFQPIIDDGQSAFCERTADLVTRGFPRLGRSLAERLVALIGMERSIYAPLRARGEIYGVLLMAGADLTEADIPAITVFANQASIAMDNAYLLQQLDSGQERLRDLAQQLVSAQEEERQRLSRALHDEAGQSLTALKISLELIKGDLPADGSSLRSRLGDAADLTDATMDRLRSLAQDLRPPALDAVGLNHTLEGFCRDFGAHTQLTIHYQGVELPRLAAEVSICLYRFLQEALTNVVKHASARQVRVALRHDAETVNLLVKDDGQGFDPQAKLSTSGEPPGLGLLGMQERLQSLGGRLRIESSPGQGTRLVAHIPLEEAYYDSGTVDPRRPG